MQEGASSDMKEELWYTVQQPQTAVLTGGAEIGIFITNIRAKKEKPSYDERSSTGKSGCGKSA